MQVSFFRYKAEKNEFGGCSRIQARIFFFYINISVLFQHCDATPFGIYSTHDRTISRSFAGWIKFPMLICAVSLVSTSR